MHDIAINLSPSRRVCPLLERIVPYPSLLSNGAKVSDIPSQCMGDVANSPGV